MANEPQRADERVRLHAIHIAGPFRITHKSYSPEFCQDWHEHEAASLDFVLAGSGTGVYGGEQIISAAGAVEYFGPGVRHRFSSGVRGIRTLHVVMPSEVTAAVRLAAPTLVRELEPSLVIAPAVQILEEMTQSRARDTLLLESLALDLLDRVAGAAPSARDEGRWLDVAREMLIEEPGEAQSLGTLAARLGLHPSHLARNFRRAHGVTVGEFGRRVRLARAARRLAERAPVPIASIALEQGFSDQAHFTRRFRSAYGCTPREFRRRLGRPPETPPSSTPR